MKTSDHRRLTITLFYLSIMICSIRANDDDNSDIFHPGIDKTSIPKPPELSKYTEIADLKEFLSTTGQEGTSGYIVLFCGEDAQRPNSCSQIVDQFKLMRHYATDLKQEYIYFNLNKGDLRIANYFYLDRIPLTLFIKDRRVYIYGHHEFSVNALASFVQYLDKKPDFMWRRFPTKERTSFDSLFEGLYRLQDKLESMTAEMPLARNTFYFLLFCLGMMFTYGVIMFFYELITGNVYKRMTQANNLEADLTKTAHQTKSEPVKAKAD